MRAAAEHHRIDAALSLPGTALWQELGVDPDVFRRLAPGQSAAEPVVWHGPPPLRRLPQRPALTPAARKSGFATLRALLDPKSLEGVVQRYQTNVMTGNYVQGPMYANSVIRPVP